MSLEARLRYIYPEGATKALAELGWTPLGKKSGCCRFMPSGPQSRWRLPGVFPSRKLYRKETMQEMVEALGIDYEEFERAYIRGYGGDPPLPGM